MSNWQYPQWIMLTIILFEFVGGCIRLTKTEAEMIKRQRNKSNLLNFILSHILCLTFLRCGFLRKVVFGVKTTTQIKPLMVLNPSNSRSFAEQEQKVESFGLNHSVLPNS